MTADPLYVGIDCSTTAAKAVVFDVTGHAVSSARSPITMSRPRAGWHEQDAEQWWTATRDALGTAVGALSRSDAARVAAVCITHQRESFVCLDGADRPRRPAILWLDSRATTEIAEYGSAEIATVSGKPPDITPALYKLAWLVRHEPDTVTEAVRIGDVQAYLALRLTGRWATGVGSADALGLMDITTGAWSPLLLDVAGVRAEQLPELVRTGDPIGTIRDAESFGLPGSTPLIAGTGDGQAAGLGADSGRPGVAYLNLGTSMVTGVLTEHAVTDPAYRTLIGPAPRTLVLETFLNSAGYLTAWFRDTFGEITDEDSAAVAPGSDGLLTLPYWNAVQSPYWDANARGATVGWRGAHTRAHLYRSILEGVAFELRLQLASLDAAINSPVHTLHAVGGGARSELWLRIIADVTGRAITRYDGEISAKGAAIIARAGTTEGPDGIVAAAAAMASPGSTVQPEQFAPYADSFAAYRLLYEGLRSVFAVQARST